VNRTEDDRDACECSLAESVVETTAADLAIQVRARLPQVTGSLITSVRDACRNGLLDWSPRVMLAMYTCDIQASS
jgi:translation elongation factor EF-G